MTVNAPIVETVDPAVLTAWYNLFLTQFPEFTDTTLYPVAMVEAWVAPAVEQVNPCRFGTQYNLAVCLYLAHNVVLSARELQASESGNTVVGQAYSSVAAKSIDKLSISYTAGTTIEGAGAFNGTSYGQRYYKLLQTYGTGPFYVGRRGRC